MFVQVRFNKPDLTTPYPPFLVVLCAPEFMAGIAPCRRSSENTSLLRPWVTCPSERNRLDDLHLHNFVGQQGAEP